MPGPPDALQMRVSMQRQQQSWQEEPSDTCHAESGPDGIHCPSKIMSGASNCIHDVVREAELLSAHAGCLWSGAAAATELLDSLEPAPSSTAPL